MRPTQFVPLPERPYLSGSKANRTNSSPQPNGKGFVFPIMQTFELSQAEDISLTMAIFYEPDSLSSLKSCTSFTVVLNNQGDQRKASKLLGKQAGPA